MKKHSITVSSEEAARLINNMLGDYREIELHVGVNYTSDSRVYECAKRLEAYGDEFVTGTMGKDFNLRKEFNKFHFCKGMDVFMTDPTDDHFIYNLYYRNKDLVTLEFDDVYHGDRKYMVFVDNPYYKNGEHGFEVCGKETHLRHVFLETNSAKIAFNMVNRIVANMRYPKTKYVW